MNISVEIRNIINRLRPTGAANVDTLQFDYQFYTELEKLAKKDREKALDEVKNASKNPNTPGEILRGRLFATELVSNDMSVFDPEKFIDDICAHYKDDVQKWKLREIMGSAKKTTKRNTYKVKDADD